jgi:putative ABC transport system permease protein
MHSPLWPLLTGFSWQELRHHPWRNAAAVVSVMLGVALAFSVHLINASALDEFSQAVRSVGGQPDLELRFNTTAQPADAAPVAPSVLARLLHHPDVVVASPVLEISTYALGTDTAARRTLLRIVGVDALQVASVAPDLMPWPESAAGRLDLFAPEAVFLNAAARRALGSGPLQLQQGLHLKPVRVAGHVQATGPPLAVMDIAAVQDLFGRQAEISRIDVRLRSGVDRDAWVRTLQSGADWPAGTTLAPPGDAAQRMGKLSRAYRVNLTVLALVALFTGGFLVFSVLALSVTRRAQQFALLGVLGLTSAQRMRLVLWEAAALGAVGSAMGIALGTALATLALHLLGGDLGGGFFAGSTPVLQWSTGAAAVFGTLGVVAALAGAWWPAQLARGLAPAQTLKGLGALDAHASHPFLGATLLASGAAMALVPPLWDIPIAAYASVALLLVGGITSLPWMVGVVLDRVAPLVGRHALPLLAVERARRVRQSAAVAVSGVVASLSLAVALTVMVASFRHSVTQWLDAVLPAALYVRTASSGSANDTAYFDPAFVQAAARAPGVERLTAQRTLPLVLDTAQPAVTLIVRPLHDAQSGALGLPLIADALPVPPGRIGIYVSEAVVDLYGARPGSAFPALYKAFVPLAPVDSAQPAMFFVAGVWRDYARQFGTIAMEQSDFARLSPDRRVNDMAFWLTPGADLAAVRDELRQIANRLANTPGGEAGALLEFGSAAEIRATSLRIFDRSFAVTYWLQAVAIGIGLFGVAASFSAQVLARRKEFGLLVHLGLTRRQILQVIAGEGAAWTTLGALAGIALGLAVAMVLVHVVNPQSFHWTMELTLPWLRLLALGGAVVLAGTVTAWLTGRAAASRDAVLAVKEDW